jgi:RND family efflux transporter MFP subunit
VPWQDDFFVHLVAYTNKELAVSVSNGQMNRMRLPEQQSVGPARSDHRSGSNGEPHQHRTGGANLSSRVFGRSNRTWLIVAAAAVGAAGFGVVSLARSDRANDVKEQPRILAVKTVTVEPVTSYAAARKYTGAIVARRTSELGFELAGKLTEIQVNEGDTVTAGTALAEVDTEHLETNRQKLVAKRAQAVALLDEMLAGPRSEDIAAARARVASLQAQVELLKLQTARQKRLVPSGATTQDEYEQYAFGLKAREAGLSEAQHSLEELLNGTRKEQIAAQRAVVAELDAAIAEIDVDLRKSTLTAPFDGTIARRFVEAGTVVNAGQRVFRLIEDGALEAWIGLPAQAAARLTVGASQRVNIQGESFDAVVASRFPEVDPSTRTRTVVLELDSSASERIVHGQLVRLELEETVEADGFWLPPTALTKGARGLWSALVGEEERSSDSTTQTDLLRVARRDLEVLHTESDRVLVRGTLHAGEQVITGGTHRVVPGQVVRPAK